MLTIDPEERITVQELLELDMSLFGIWKVYWCFSKWLSDNNTTINVTYRIYFKMTVFSNK